MRIDFDGDCIDVEVENDDFINEADKKLIISNYKEEISEKCKRFHLRPYEARVYVVK